MIQKITGGDLFQIEPVTAYPKDYTKTTEVTKNELRAKARPELKEKVINMGAYDVTLLGINCVFSNQTKNPVYFICRLGSFDGRHLASEIHGINSAGLEKNFLASSIKGSHK